VQTNLTRMRRGYFVMEPTFQCNARCEHCMHECSPDRHETMPLPLFCSCVQQALELGWRTICLTGGEPFLLPDHIAAAAEMCRRQGADLVVQTNGFWGRNAAAAREMLQGMRGITQIGFSVDKAHLKEVGLGPVLQALKACIEEDILNLSVSISYQTNHEFEVLKEQFTSLVPGIDVAGWPILPVGRGRTHPELLVDAFTYPWNQLRRNCDTQLQLTPIVHPNGDLHPCYRTVMALEEGDPLLLGNASSESVPRLLADVSNKLFMFVVAYGGGGLGYLLRGSPYESLLDDSYQGVCHFCFEVLARRSVVSYFVDLLAEGSLDASIAAGLERAYGQSKGEKAAAPRERIFVCNGTSCGQSHQFHPTINYLINRLVDLKKIQLVKVETVNCLKACGKGPNLYLEGKGRLLTGLTPGVIDQMVEELGTDVPEAARV
jgi:hypothetical protein